MRSGPAGAQVAAILAGCAVGSLLLVGNLFLSLKAGLWEGGLVAASLLAYGLLTAARRSPSAQDTNLAQSAATAMAAAPAAAGLVGPIPALALLGATVPAWGVAAWGAALGVLGVLLAHLVRERLLAADKLPFPTGIATAEVISALHSEGGGNAAKARWLLWAALAALAVTVARDVLGWLPQSLHPPLSFSGAPAAALAVGLAVSPLMLGAGALVPPSIGIAAALGGVLAWTVLGPWAAGRGFAGAADFGSLAPWMLWPGTGLLLGGSLVPLASQARNLRAALADLRAVGAGAGAAPVVLALGATAAAVAVSWGVFGLGPVRTLAALACFVILGLVAARAAGQTDVAPLGPLGQLTQLGFGATGAGLHANVAAGSVVAGGAAQTAGTLWSLRAGLVLGTPPRAQGRAQLAGALLGAALAAPAYALVVRAYGLGSASLPAPSARQWEAVARVASGGVSALPRGALVAAAVALALGIALSLLASSPARWARWVPSPLALGMALLIPAAYSAALAVGALAAAVLSSRTAAAAALVAAVAAGVIAGESVGGLVAAGLAAAGLAAP